MPFVDLQSKIVSLHLVPISSLKSVTKAINIILVKVLCTYMIEDPKRYTAKSIALGENLGSIVIESLKGGHV